MKFPFPTTLDPKDTHLYLETGTKCSRVEQTPSSLGQERGKWCSSWDLFGR